MTSHSRTPVPAKAWMLPETARKLSAPLIRRIVDRSHDNSSKRLEAMYDLQCAIRAVPFVCLQSMSWLDDEDGILAPQLISRTVDAVVQGSPISWVALNLMCLLAQNAEARRMMLASDTVSVVVAHLRACSHEAKCAGLELLCLLTDDMPPHLAGRTLATSGSARLFIKLLKPGDGSEELYRVMVCTLLTRLLEHPKSKVIIMSSDILLVLQQLALSEMLTPPEWDAGKTLYKAVRASQRVAEIRGEWSREEAPPPSYDIAVSSPQRRTLSRKPTRQSASGPFGGGADAVAAPDSSTSDEEAVDSSTPVAGEPPSTRMPLPAKEPPCIFDVATPPSWTQSGKSRKQELAAAAIALYDAYELSQSEPTAGAPEPGSLRPYAGWFQARVMKVEGVALPERVCSSDRPARVFVRLCPVAGDGSSGEQGESGAVLLPMSESATQWTDDDLPILSMAFSTTLTDSPTPMVMLCELWAQGHGLRDVLLGSSTWDVSSRVGKTLLVEESEDIVVKLHGPSSADESGSLHFQLAHGEGQSPYEIAMEEHRAAIARAMAGASPMPKRGRSEWAAARSPQQHGGGADGDDADGLGDERGAASGTGVFEDDEIEAEPVFSGVMVFKVTRASGVPALGEIEGSGKRRPYVKLVLMDSVKDMQLAASRCGTARQASGDDANSYDWRHYSPEVTLSYTCPESTKLTLVCELWDERLDAQDKLLGRAEVNVSGWIGQTSRVRVVTCPMLDHEGAWTAGTVYLNCETVSSAGDGQHLLEAYSEKLTQTGLLVGALRFVVKEGRRLKNMDMFSKQDPYVRLALVDAATGSILTTGQSGVIRRGGTDPVWTDEDNNVITLRYSVPHGTAVKLVVEAWDEDAGLSDDLIGMVSMDITHMLSGPVPPQQMLCKLKDAKGSRGRGVVVLQASGAAYVEKTPVLPPHLFVQGMIQVSVVRGEGLYDQDTFTKQDPYVKLALLAENGAVFAEGRTSTVHRGGRNPSWSPKDATVCLRYKQKGGTKLTLAVEAWDADVGLRDDLIGQVLVDFSTFVGRVVADEVVTCELQRTATKLTAKGRGRLILSVSSGVIQVGKHRQSIADSASLQLGEYLVEEGGEESKLVAGEEGSESKLSSDVGEGKDGSEGKLEGGVALAVKVREGGTHTGIVSVTVSEGRNLLNMDRYSKQDPYVKLQLVDGSGRVQSEAQSSVVRKGGRNPLWILGNVLPMRYSASLGTKLYLVVKAYDHDVGSADDYIGGGALDVSDIVGEGVASRQMLVRLTNDGTEVVDLPETARAGASSDEAGAGGRAGGGAGGGAGAGGKQIPKPKKQKKATKKKRRVLDAGTIVLSMDAAVADVAVD